VYNRNNRNNRSRMLCFTRAGGGNMSMVNGTSGRKMETDTPNGTVLIPCEIAGFAVPEQVELRLPGYAGTVTGGTIVRVPLKKLSYEQIDWLAEDFRAKLILAAGISDQRTREPK
jgi:hypothetical protein